MISVPISINFGTDGFRGVIGDNFTFEIVNYISLSLGSYLNGISEVSHDKNQLISNENLLHTVAIGYDTRFLSKEFALTAAAALSSMGIKSILSNTFCPSPVLSYFVKNKQCSLGIMITASHNPYMFNGIKFKSRFGSSMLEKDAKEIENIANSFKCDADFEKSKKSYYISPNKFNPQGNFEYADFKKDYIEHLVNFTEIDSVIQNTSENLLNRLEVVIDPMFGAGIGYLSDILKRFSIKYSLINNNVNPSFPDINPEPIDNNLSKLKSSLKRKGIKNEFAVGFATDGDADRVGAVDSYGNFIDSHKIFLIILNFLIEEGCSGSVVKTVSVSKSIDNICKLHNLKLYEVPIGFKNIAELMTKKGSDVFIGGEESGGIGILAHLPERDGILMALMLLKIMLVRKKTLNELLTDIFNGPYPYVYKRIDLHLQDEKKRLLIKGLKNKSFKIPFENDVTSTNFMDGFKYEYSDNSWLLIRPSGTESLLRIYAESKDENRTDLLIGRVKEELDCLQM